MDQCLQDFVQTKLESFGVREFPSFMKWMREQWDANPATLLAVNPSNGTGELPDGSMHIALGDTAVLLKKRHQKASEKTPYAYQIRREGKLRKVIRALPRLSGDEQLESAMALFVESKDGYLVCNAPEFRYIEEIVGRKYEGLDNPFYRAVCEAIIEGFVESGWMESPLE